MDAATPNIFDGSYFGLAVAKKMPLTIDLLVGMDPKTEPVLKSMEAKTDALLPLFSKAKEKLGALKVLTGRTARSGSPDLSSTTRRPTAVCR